MRAFTALYTPAAAAAAAAAETTVSMFDDAMSQRNPTFTYKRTEKDERSS